MKICVTVTRTGVVYVEAASLDDAESFVNNNVSSSEVQWDDYFAVTDSEEDDMEDEDDYIKA